MRQVLVDHARRHRAKKRGGGDVRIDLDAVPDDARTGAPDAVDMLRLDGALSELAAIDPPRASIVEMRYFAGMTLKEIGAVVGRPEWDVKKDWLLAKAWLKRNLREAR